MDAVHQLNELATLRTKTLEQNKILNEQHKDIAKLRGLEPAAAQARKERDGAVAKQKAAEQAAAASRRTADNANRRARAAESRAQELESALARATTRWSPRPLACATCSAVRSEPVATYLCRSCGHEFASVAAFDHHRVGKHAYTLTEGLRMEPPVEDGRRCLAELEMADAGLGLDAHGRWYLIAAAGHARARFARTPVSASGIAQEATGELLGV